MREKRIWASGMRGTQVLVKPLIMRMPLYCLIVDKMHKNIFSYDVNSCELSNKLLFIKHLHRYSNVIKIKYLQTTCFHLIVSIKKGEKHCE